MRIGFKYMKIVNQSVEFRGMTEDPWRVINEAARVSHDSEVPADKAKQFAFVKRLVELGHLTPLEFVTLRFHIVTDRGVANELTRHRVGVAFVQRSTRYCNESELEVISPVPRENIPFLYTWARSVQVAQNSYRELVDMGVAKQLARSVLPLCTATELEMTVNLRELRQIVLLRSAQSAHPQMRELMSLLIESLTDDVKEVLGVKE